jgi:hypothetical protein
MLHSAVNEKQLGVSRAFFASFTFAPSSSRHHFFATMSLFLLYVDKRTNDKRTNERTNER